MNGSREPTCVLTPKQVEATDLLGSDARHIALWGGSRSGKTFIILRAIIMRAIRAAGSRHLVARLRKAHIIASIGRDTLPKVMSLCFPERALQTGPVRLVHDATEQV